MQRVILIICQQGISKAFQSDFQLYLEDDAFLLDAIKAADEEINKKCKNSPVKVCKSLLQMPYHPIEDRFYKQVAIQARRKSQPLSNISAR